MTKKGRLAGAKLPSFLSKREKEGKNTSDVLTKNTIYYKINYTNIRRLMYIKQQNEF